MSRDPVINLEAVRAVCDTYLSRDRGGLCHAVTGNAVAVPQYNPRERRLPICEAALRNGAVGRICKGFYQNLPLAAGEIECPFGVTLLFQRVTVSGQLVCLYQQVRCVPHEEPAKELPRIPKKAAIVALTESTRPSDGPSAKRKFDQGRELLTTLYLGRVAESIRMLSHHLLTPLQGAIADAEALFKDGQLGDPEVSGRLSRNLEEINDSAKQIQILLSEDSEFSIQKLRNIQIVAIVQELVRSLEPQAQKQGVQIEHILKHARRVEAIPDQLRVVLSNLLQNAVKYSFNERIVRITYNAEGERLVVQFHNEGCGISPDEITGGRIFELGYRGRDSCDRGRTGTGTGLYIAARIAKAHDAQIRVSSTKAATASDPKFQAYHNRIELVWPVYSRHKS